MTEYKPLFNNQHYVWLASAMRDANSQFTWASDRMIVRQTAESLAASLKGDNPAFDEEHFLNLIFSLHALSIEETVRVISMPVDTSMSFRISNWWSTRKWRVYGKFFL